MSICRKPYPSDVSAEERSLIVPYLLSDCGDPLETMIRVVDFEMVRPALEAALAYGDAAKMWSASPTQPATSPA